MDVSKLVEDLCASVLREGFCDRSTDYVLKSLSRPTARSAWKEEEKLRHIKRLKYDVFDKLLLRKWEWFGCEEREMSVESCCLSSSHNLGGAGHAKRLHIQLERWKDSVLTEKEAVLQFLCLMSNYEGGQAVFNDSGVCLSESYLSLFEGLPRVDDVSNIHAALSSSKLLFESSPGTGFCGWSSQQPLYEDRTPLHTSLFGGLTRSTVADLNTKLDLPRFLVQPSPRTDISTSPLLRNAVSSFTSLSCIDMTGSEDSVIDVSFSGEGEACDLMRQWEGWQTRCGYLSELPCFSDSSLLAFQRLKHVAKVSESLPLPQPGDIIRRLRIDMDRTRLPDHASPEVGGTRQAMAALLQVLMIYCRSQLTTISERATSDLSLLTQTHCLLPLSQFVLKLVKGINVYPKAFDLVDNLHSLAIAGQGHCFYPLLLSMLAYVLQPYFRFVEQWVFLGQLDCGVEFGIHGDQETLEKRDENYWRSGYVMTSRCTPTFLASHAGTLLTAGKALNLLKLCNPKHPLCSGNNKPIKLKVYFNASACEQIHTDCHSYSEDIAEQIKCNTKLREDELETRKRLAREVVEQRRDVAMMEVDRIKKAEEAMEDALKEKKKLLLHEMQHQMETAIAAKLEKAASEKKEDAEMMEKLTNHEKMLTQQEETLAAEVRAELMAHYAELSKEAELRQARAEWKIKRMNLQEKRVKLLQNDEAYWTDLSLVAKQLDADHTPATLHDSSSDNPVIPVRPVDEVTTSLELSQPNVRSHDLSCDPVQLGSEVEEGKGQPLGDGTVAVSGEQSLQLKASQDVLTQHKLEASQDVLTQHKLEAPLEDSGTVPSQETTPPTPQHLPLTSSDRTPLSSEESELSSKENLLPANSQGYPHLISSRGQAPKSTIEQIMYGVAEPQQFMSTRGHAPPSTIHRLMYPLLTEVPLPEGEGQTEHGGPLFETTESGPSSKFQDDFSKLGELPMRDILSCVLGPLQQDTSTVDCSFLSLYPLDSLLETCIALPLITQARIVNEALLDYFLHSCDINKHFVALKKFLLMEDGEFSHVLSTQLCEQLTFGRSSHYLCSSSFLNPLLSLSLESSLHGRCPQAQRLAFRIKHQPMFIRTHAVDALDFLELKYEVEWPSNIIITSSMIDKYNKVFQLLLEMKRASWALKTTFHRLRQSHQLKEEESRQLQIYRHEFQHFVNVMHEYMSNQLFCISWREFEVELATKVHSLDELVQAHKRFVDNAIFRCLLSKKAKPVMNVIQEVLSSILCFSFQSNLVSSSPQKTYKLMCDTHRKFSDGTGLLIKVVSKLVARGYQPHLEDLLLRLNFNNFYHHTRVYR